ncbi:MAG: hypothetical protein KBC30_00030 [Planctomycetes bacterium]|jgi:DNA ligase-1|nr:hypothetical protein [Planctomycetota bacterium]HPY73887.1 hypothetical protein [Planctomycetota bacterium]HQA99411.1 hypothetical protein [Planctomycetota bacterium]
MQIVLQNNIQDWLQELDLISAYKLLTQKGLSRQPSIFYLKDILEIPLSLCYALQYTLEENPNAEDDSLDSLPFFSLLYGLYLPLSGITPQKCQSMFQISYNHAECIDNQQLAVEFLQTTCGLSMLEKVSILMGDPFYGKNSRIGQDSLLQVLSCLRLDSPEKLRGLLPQMSDIGMLFSEKCSLIKSDPPISAKEVLIILRNLPKLGIRKRKDVLIDLFTRAGRLERYYLVRLILRRLNFGYEYRMDNIVQALAEYYQIPIHNIQYAIDLSNIYDTVHLLETEGIQGLHKIVLKPLQAISPALAIGGVEEHKSFPMILECKYDGIRLMSHKETFRNHTTKYAAFTRRKNDWLELVYNLKPTLQMIPANSYIVDGELHGTVWQLDHKRQATVYEIYRYLQGHQEMPLRLSYVLFDILYYNGQDLTGFPLYQRRKILESLLISCKNQPLPLPITISESYEVQNTQEVNKWYQFFINQGHEGIIVKIPNSTYPIGQRTNQWMKKKTEYLLDLAITGAYWSTSDRGPQTFSTYQLSCLDQNQWREIGRTAGLALEQNKEIIQRILTEFLVTGQMIETRTSSGIQQGIQLTPSIIVTVKFEDILRDQDNKYSLRSPKIVYVRPRGDSSPSEIDTYQIITQLYLQRRLV